MCAPRAHPELLCHHQRAIRLLAGQPLGQHREPFKLKAGISHGRQHCGARYQVDLRPSHAQLNSGQVRATGAGFQCLNGAQGILKKLLRPLAVRWSKPRGNIAQARSAEHVILDFSSLTNRATDEFGRTFPCRSEGKLPKGDSPLNL